MTRLGYQIPNFTYPDVGSAALFDVVAAEAREADTSGFDTVLVTAEAEADLAALFRRRGADLGSMSDEQRAAVTGRIVTGDPDTVAERLAADLEHGIDGWTLNAPANGHVPGRVALLGDTVSKLLR